MTKVAAPNTDVLRVDVIERRRAELVTSKPSDHGIGDGGAAGTAHVQGG